MNALVRNALVWVSCTLLWIEEPTASAQALPGPKPHVPEGWRLVEGDILVPFELGFGAVRKSATFTSDDLWPDGEVLYEFDDNVSESNKDRAKEAMAVWQGAANVRFRPREGFFDLHYIHIQNSTGNSSPVGRHTFQHDVNIHDWESRYVIVHELGHTLGFWHEQSRSDRDSYIEINWLFVQGGESHNFDIHDEANHYGPYDFGSVMHYSACAFSIFENCRDGDSIGRTIIVLPPYDVEWQSEIGQRKRLSYWDKRVMSFLYPESNWRFVDASRCVDFPGSGTFFSPYCTFLIGALSVPAGGTIWIDPGIYSAVGLYVKPMTVQSALGGVTLY